MSIKKINAHENTLFLIDGSSFLYRAYYGLRPLHTPQGAPVQAVYGFCRMIKKLIDTFDPKNIIVVWDSKGKTERHELFPAYKATRQAPPSDLFDQKALIIDFIDTIGIIQVAQTGIEADDLINSLALTWLENNTQHNTPHAAQHNNTKHNVIIISSDKDMGQILTDQVTILDTFKEKIIDTHEFTEQMGFSPHKTVFYFSLVGDNSDNIPGVRGIGPKGALELVTQFDSLQDLYKNLDKITKTRIKIALEEHKEDAFLSESLFAMKQYPIEPKILKNTHFDHAQWAQAREFFEKLNFKSLLKDLPTNSHDQATHITQETSPVLHSREKNYQFTCVTTQEQLDNLVAHIKQTKLFAYDTETIGLNPFTLKLIGISICCAEKSSYYIPFGHIYPQDHIQVGALLPEQLPEELVLKTLKPLFENQNIHKIAHNQKFDALVLLQKNITIYGSLFDTMIAASLVKEEWQKVGLKELSQRYFNEPMHTYQETVTQKKLKSFAEVPLDLATEYAAADAHQTYKLYPVLNKLLQERNVDKLYYTIEQPLIEILTDMENRGIYCDTEVITVLDKTVIKHLETIQRTIIALIPESHSAINLNSPKQVSELLFDTLKLTPQKKNSKSDTLSTDNEVLLELAKTSPIAHYILQYRELFKLKSTYIDALPQFITPKTHTIHTSYSQIRVATGRLSSSDPNLQNIPVDGLGSTIRMAFKAQKNHLFISADYSQIELRVLAYLSQDSRLLTAFKNNHDIHAETAAGIFHVPLEKITHEQRAIGKRINFSILYGLTPYGLSKDLGISLKDAKTYIETYFSHYPQVQTWMQNTIEQVKKTGYTETLFGRKRPVPGIHERNKHLYDLACRIAINTVAQGTSAELMKIGMINVYNKLLTHNYDAHILLQIHDELIISAEKTLVQEVEQIIKHELENVVHWNVPLVVAIGHGKTWKESEQKQVHIIIDHEQKNAGV